MVAGDEKYSRELSRHIHVAEVAIEDLEKIQALIIEMENLGQSDFPYFIDQISREGFFTTFQDFADRLGIAEEFTKIIESHQSTLDVIPDFYKKVSNEEEIPQDQFQNLVNEYKSLISELMKIFSDAKV